MSDTQTYVVAKIQWATGALQRANLAVLTDEVASIDWRYIENELEEALDETMDAHAISQEMKHAVQPPPL